MNFFPVYLFMQVDFCCPKVLVVKMQITYNRWKIQRSSTLYPIMVERH
jgi:hypothetical protein